VTTETELLVGRRATLGELRTTLARTATGIGSCLVVEGLAGMGKTQLLRWLAVEAARLDFTVAAGQATELDRGFPLATLMGALRGQIPQLCTSILQDAESQYLWWMDQVRAALEDEARDCPLLVLLDDVHLADELTALALRILVPALSGAAVLWLLARRPYPVRGPTQSAQAAIDWLIREGARRVQLDPLDDVAVAELCTHALNAIPDQTLLTLVTQCQGNPFLLRELLTALRQTGQLAVKDGLATVVDTRLPADFLSAVSRHLADLPVPVRRLLEVGAVLGRPFTLHEAAGLLGCAAVDLVPAAVDGVGSGRLVDQDDGLTFQQEIIREALYASLSGSVRSALHRQAATVLQQEGRSVVEVAEHLVACGHPGTDRAKQLLRAAVEQLTPTAPGAAADLMLRTLELFDVADTDYPWLVADAVRLLAAAGRIEPAQQLGEQALRSGLEAPCEAALLIGLSEALKHAGRNSAVVDYTGRALALEGVPDATQARLLAIRAHGLLDAMDLAAAECTGAEATKVGTRSEQPTAVVFGMVACSVVSRTRGALEKAIQQAREAVRTADVAGGEAAQRHPRLWLGRALVAADQFAEAEVVYEMGKREAEQLGTAWSQPLWHYYRAELRMAQGRLDEAIAAAKAGVRICDQLGAQALMIPLLSLLGRAAIHRDDLVQAREYLQRAQALKTDGIGAWPESQAWLAALLADATGEPGAALDVLAEIYDGFPDRLQILTEEPAAGAQLVRIALRAGSDTYARAAAASSQLLAERNPTVPSLVGAAAHAAGVQRGDRAALHYAVQVYRASPRVLARASAMEDTAWAERAAGQRATAINLLCTALGHYKSCGAQRDVARVTMRLNRLGARRALPKDTPVTGPWDTLTDAELRVVRLVAQGLTNREVASQLSLSPHTVDSHLRHTFTKLGVNSRVELTRQVLKHDSGE
jgi:DNA-binding CsgD family transcriptional regulator/tetratricopeptide (TPR) repeat protein